MRSHLLCCFRVDQVTLGPSPIWVATRFCSGPAIIHTLHLRIRAALVFLWSPKPNLCRRYTGLRSLSCGKSGHCCPLHAACDRLPWWLDVVESTPAKPFYNAIDLAWHQTAACKT